MKTEFMCVIPQGYTIALGPHNVLVGAHPEKPVIYFDETMRRWCEVPLVGEQENPDARKTD